MHCRKLVGKEDLFQIAAACDMLPDRRERMTERYGCEGYARIEDMIADGTPEELPWIEETTPVQAGSNAVIWDHLYRAIREDATFPIDLDEEIGVMKVISAAKKETAY
jgi:hypothetical protein